MADDVLFEKRPDGVAIITLNRPDRMNAMGGQLMPMLADYLGRCLRDREIRAVVLTGAGRAFCAGGDVKEMGPRKTSDESAASQSMVGALDEGVAGLRESQLATSYVLHTMPKPTIAMVNGAAAARSSTRPRWRASATAFRPTRCTRPARAAWCSSPPR